MCVGACIDPYKYEVASEKTASRCTEQCPSDSYVDKSNKCVQECSSKHFKADLLNKYCVDECDPGTYQVSLSADLVRCSQSCWMYGMVVKSEDSAVCVALEKCESGTLRAIGVAEYMCVDGCSEKEYSIANYALGSDKVTLCVANCKSHNMVRVDQSCVASCPQPYAIKIDNLAAKCVQRCPLGDLRYVHGVLNNQEVHACVRASEYSKYDYYREMDNGTKLMVKSCNANEFKSLQLTKFSEKNSAYQCVKTCKYV